MAALEAAVLGGADAVYFGGTVFNARMNAKNFGREEIKRAVAYCHEKGVKVYVTLNTQIYDREMKSALEHASFLWAAGVDALILADLGLASLIRAYLPDFELHASTQMTCHSLDAAERLYDLGFSRIVVARELSEGNVRTLTSSRAEIELFIHGAICVSCSGQCLMSAMLGGRSGNRGECAQPCRMSYSGGYPLSLKDMCLAAHVPSLIDAGVASLKIEGRMKSPSYVYGVTKIYRRLLDERRAATPQEITELQKLFSRGGFTDGYYTEKIDSSMLGVRSEKDISDSRSVSEFRGGTAVTETVEAPAEVAERSAATLPPKPPFPPKRWAEKAIVTASFHHAGQIPESHDLAHVYLPLSEYRSAADGVILPPVIFDDERDEVRRRLERAVKQGAKHLLLNNLGHLSLAEEFGLLPHGGHRLNVFNTFAADFWARTAGLHSLLLSPELILPQIRDIVLPAETRKGVIVYGRLPLMHLQKPVGKTALRDTKGATFPILREEGRDILYNSVPIYMADQPDRLDGAGIEERHMLFTTENRGEVMRVLYAYCHKIIPKEPIRRIK